MGKGFLGILVLLAFLFQADTKGAFAERTEKTYKSWSNGIFTYTAVEGAVDIIDPVKMKKTGTISGIVGSHNCFTSYDGTSLYVTAGKEMIKVALTGKKGGGVISRNKLIDDGVANAALSPHNRLTVKPKHSASGASLAHVALTLDGKNLYITDSKDNIIVADADTLEAKKTMNLSVGLDDVMKIVKNELGETWEDSDSNPHGLALHPGGRYIYVPLVWSGAIAVIDTWIDEVITIVNLNATDSSQPGHGTTPTALGFSTDGHWCFVSCAVPGYECILDTSDPGNPKIKNAIAVGLSPIQVPANPNNKYFIVPCQTSSLLDNTASTLPDPIFDNAEWVDWVNTNTDTALNYILALFSALHSATPMEPNDDKPDACFIVEIEDNYDNDGISWEVLDTVVAGIGPHGVSYTPGGEFAFVTLAQENPGKVVVITETEPGKFTVIYTIKVGTFPNGISTKFGRNQNS